MALFDVALLGNEAVQASEEGVGAIEESFGNGTLESENCNVVAAF